MARIPATGATVKSQQQTKGTAATYRVFWVAFCAFAGFVALNAAALVIIRLRAGMPVSASGYVLFVVLPGIVFAVLLMFPLRRTTVLYGNVLALAIAFYGAQEYTVRNSPGDKFEAVRQARARGVDAVPSVHPLVFLWKDAGAMFERWESEELSLPQINGRSVLPLAGISRALTYYCKERGPLLVYESDRYGFNNPDAAWDRPVDLVFLGDSFTQGACVPPEQHFGQILRAAFPGLLNLGMGGNGPLAALATFQEYVLDLRPTHVFWLYFEGNDVLVRPEGEIPDGVSDIERELTIPVLLSYHENPEFRQGLKESRTAVDRALRSIVDAAFDAELTKRDPHRGSWSSFYRPFAEKVVLAPLAKRISFALPREQTAFARSAITSILGRPAEPIENGPDAVGAGSRVTKSTDERLAVLRSMLERLQTTAGGWDGQFHLIYLPEIAHFRFGPHPLREKVLSLAEDLGISVIDVVPLFEVLDDPETLFAFGRDGGHYNSRGYALVAEAIAESVSAPGVTTRTH